ncbi:MAG: histidine phosphatase family protein [Anaerolineae bacterium]|nr:histidine phosphatase family protein [Anaerolineae bacterium]MDQ7033951.1 histidine phosphatase family protein [Anaerolineae bacterium]
MRLYLIRHGQSANNALYEAGRERERVHDPELTEIGHQQARHVAQHLADCHDMPGKMAEPFNLTHLYCSAMTRAMQTTQPIYQALNMKAEVWVDVHEVGGLFLVDEQGKEIGFPGLTSHEMTAKFPDFILPDDVTEKGWWDTEKGLERRSDSTARALRVYEKLQDRSKGDERIAIVSHAGFIDLLIKTFLHQLPTNPNNLFYTTYNTAITRIDFEEGYHGRMVTDRMRLHYLNRVNHLSSELWTW